MRVAKYLMAGALICAANTASAALVTQWNWDATSVFVPGGSQFGGGTGVTEFIVNQPDQITWGSALGSSNPAENNNRSGIVWNETEADGSVIGGNPLVTNGGPTNTTSATHYNRNISSNFNMLQTGVIHTTLNLYVPPSTAPDAPTQAFTQDLTFFFVESPNNGGTDGTGPCLIGGPDGLCPDIFVLASGSLTDTFEYDGVEYQIQIGANIGGAPAFGPLNEDICAFDQLQTLCANLDEGQVPFGFITPENDDTTVQFTLTITALQEVPEPSTLALLGAALLGVAGLGLRRRTRA